jgi:sirohydrochlorin ferrochelatase
MSLDFSRLKSAARSLLTKRSEFLSIGSNNAILEFLLEGTPEVREHLRDSRKDVDKRLKTVCEALIADCTSSVVRPIQTFLAQVKMSLT